jgi:hypothetical protein
MLTSIKEVLRKVTKRVPDKSNLILVLQKSLGITSEWEGELRIFLLLVQEIEIDLLCDHVEMPSGNNSEVSSDEEHLNSL